MLKSIESLVITDRNTHEQVLLNNPRNYSSRERSHKMLTELDKQKRAVQAALNTLEKGFKPSSSTGIVITNQVKRKFEALHE